MLVEIWSDIVCPWCNVGRARFAKALENFEHRDEVEIRFRSYELDPNAPSRRDRSMAEHISAKYGMEVPEAQRMNDHLEEVAAVDGVEIHFDHFRAGNTFDAHRLLHLAADRGVQTAVNDALMEAVFRDGVAIGDVEALTSVVVAAGLDEAEVRQVLAGDTYATEVEADELRAQQLNITGVPFFLFEERFVVPGAQSVERFELALDTVWQKTHERPEDGSADTAG